MFVEKGTLWHKQQTGHCLTWCVNVSTGVGGSEHCEAGQDDAGGDKPSRLQAWQHPWRPVHQHWQVRTDFDFRGGTVKYSLFTSCFLTVILKACMNWNSVSQNNILYNVHHVNIFDSILMNTDSLDLNAHPFMNSSTLLFGFLSGISSTAATPWRMPRLRLPCGSRIRNLCPTPPVPSPGCTSKPAQQPVNYT